MAGRRAGEVERLGAGKGQPQGGDVAAPHHQRLAEHELIVHDDAGRHEHEPPP